MTKVSIIVPCYNQARFLPKAVASLQAQTLEDWECIIVDDGSTDNTAEVVSNLALRDERVRLVQQLNGGSASARDTGLKTAKGLFIQFLDADDTIAPDKLERQVAQMEHDGLDISYTAFCSETTEGLRTAIRSVPLSLHTVLIRWGLGASTPIHSFMYRTEFIRRNRLWFHSECKDREDWKWHIKSFMAHPKQAVLPQIYGAIYYDNQEGKTGSYKKIQQGNFRFMAYMAEQLHGCNHALWTLRISAELWIWMLRMVKYRSTEICPTVKYLCSQPGTLVAAILLMPVSLLGIINYFIKTYITK